jgi:hypothetical protein
VASGSSLEECTVGSDDFPHGSLQWYQAWQGEEKDRRREQTEQYRQGLDYIPHHGLGLPKRLTLAWLSLDNQASRARRDYALAHGETLPDQPGWWERRLYGDQDSPSVGRSGVHAAVSWLVPVVACVTVSVGSGFPKGLLVASALMVVVSRVMLKRFLSFTALLVAVAALGYLFGPTRFAALSAGSSPSHWTGALVFVTGLTIVMGVLGIRRAFGFVYGYENGYANGFHNPRALDWAVYLSAVAGIAAAVPFFLAHGLFVALPVLLVVWLGLSGVGPSLLYVFRGLVESVRAVTWKHLWYERELTEVRRIYGQ